MFRGAPQHTGVYAGSGVPQFTKIKWQFHSDGQILSSPAIANGTLYVGSSDHFLYALDLAAGTLKWKFKTESRITSSPAVSGGLVYFGSFDSNFYAVEAATGKEKWRFKTGEDPEIHNQQGIQSSAAVADGVVFFGCRDSNFYAVDAATGKQRWSFSNKGSWVIATPAVLDGKVYFGTSDTGLFRGLDAKSGADLFSVDFKHWPMFSSPAVAGDLAYIGSHLGKLYAINLKTQKLAWTFETENSRKNGGSFTKADGTPNYEGVFSDFFYDDMVAGVQQMMSVGAILSSPVVSNGTIYVGSADGNVYALI